MLVSPSHSLCIEQGGVVPNYEYTNTRDRLIIESKQDIEGEDAASKPLEGHFRGSMTDPTPVHLGDVKTDDHGRLIFIAGSGVSQCVSDPQYPQPFLMWKFDNDNWARRQCLHSRMLAD